MFRSTALALAFCWGLTAPALESAWSLKDTTKSLIEPSFWVAQAGAASGGDDEFLADKESPKDETVAKEEAVGEHKNNKKLHSHEQAHADEETRRALADEMDTVFEELDTPASAVAISREIRAHKRPSSDDEDGASIVDAEESETTAFGESHPKGHRKHTKKETETTSELSTDPPTESEENDEDDISTEEETAMPPMHSASDDDDFTPIFSDSPSKKKHHHHTREDVASLDLGEEDPAAAHKGKRHRHHDDEESPMARFLQKLLSDMPDATHTPNTTTHTNQTQPAIVKEHTPEVETVETTPHKKKHRVIKETEGSFTKKFPGVSDIAHRLRHPLGGGTNHTKSVQETQQQHT